MPKNEPKFDGADRAADAHLEPTEAGADAPGGDDDVARRAGRGGLAVTFGKGWFILQGLLQQILLPRILGLGGYGALSSALSLASIPYNTLVTTGIQGVSRAVAGADDATREGTARTAIGVHAALAVPSALAFFALAGPVGSWTGAPHIVPSLRMLSVVMLCYGIYAPVIGNLNGRQRFLTQAAFDILMATLRTAGLLGVAWLFLRAGGNGPLGATAGFALVAAIILGIALLVGGVGRRGPSITTVREHLTFIGPLLLGHLLFNLLLQADVTLLRAFAAEAATTASRPVEAADPLVGAYRAAQLFAFLPYQGLISVTFVLFPLVAKAERAGDREAVARYIAEGVRVALIIAGAMVGVTSGLARHLLDLVFGPQAANLGERALQVLSIGFGAFAILGILNTVLNSLHRERSVLTINATAFALVVVFCFGQVRGTPFGEGLLFYSALATSFGLMLATLAAAFTVQRVAGAVVSPLRLLRIVACTAGAILLGRALPDGGKLMTLAYSAIVGVAYLAALLATREFTGRDIALLRRVVGRR